VNGRCLIPSMRTTREDRVGGTIAFIAGLVVLVSWLHAGFRNVSLVWQLDLGVPLLLVLADYGLLMIGKACMFRSFADLFRRRRRD
jgi:uncharacterized membrane protein